MIKIGAVWSRKKEDGTPYFKGTVDCPVGVVLADGLDILLFKNKSDHENAPDFDVLVAKPRPKPETKSVPADEDFPA